MASQLLSFSDPLGRTTTSEYDDLGRTIRVIQPDPDGVGPLAAPVTTRTYDLVSNELSMTDPLGHVTDYEYDNLYRLVRRTDEDLDGPGPRSRPVTQYAYDLVNNLLSLIDPSGNTTGYRYDNLDRLTGETIELDPGNFVSRNFSYDSMNNLVQRTDRDGRATRYAYDDLYRPIEESWLGPLGSVVHTIQLQFDEADQLLRAEDVTADSRYDYTYDNLSRVTHTAINNGGPVVELANAFDANSRLTEQMATIGGTADFRDIYAYDGLNRLTRADQIGQPGGNTVAEKRVDFDYNAAGQFTAITRFTDVAGGPSEVVAESTYGYDGIGRLVNLRHGRVGATVADYQWQFDPASRITQHISSIDGTVNYNYDNVNQLTAAAHDFQNDESYQYDENGNRTQTGYTTGVHNRLTSDGTYTYEYDAEGNRTKRIHIASGEVTEYEWDHRNRLVRVTQRAAGVGPATHEVQHTYDALNRWIATQVDPDGDGPLPAETTRFVYDGNQIVLQLDDSGQLTHRYLWGPAVDQVLADEQIGAAETLWPLSDHLGTVRELLDSAGNIANHVTYDSFGNVTSQTNPAVDHLFGFTGRPFDKATGLQNNLNRWYDPAVGRWLSEDPIGFDADDANLYRYASNRPTTLIDPTGNSDTARAFVAAARWHYDTTFADTRAKAQFGLGFAKGVRHGIPEGAVSIAQAVIKGGNALNLTALAVYAGLELPGGDRALNMANRIYAQEFQGIHEAAQIFNGLSLSDKLGVVQDLAGKASESIQESIDEFEKLMQQGCYKQAGEMFGEIVGKAFTELFLGAKGAGKVCFVAGTLVAVPYYATLHTSSSETGVAPQLDPSEDPDSRNSSWDRQTLALAIGCTMLTAAAWTLDRRRRSKQSPKPGMLEQIIAELTNDSSRPASPSSRSRVPASKCVPPVGDTCSPPGHTASKRTPWRYGYLIAGLLFSAVFLFKAAPKLAAPYMASAVNSASAYAPPLPKGRLGGDEPTNTPTTPIPTHSLKPIETLSPGDQVLSHNPATGDISAKPISQTFHRISDHLRILKIRASDATTTHELKTTNEHPFWVHPQGWTKARDLNPGDQLLQPDGALSTILATTHELHPEGIEVYNFEVIDYHTYFVTAHGARAPPVWVHNKSIAKVLKNAIKRVRSGKKGGSSVGTRDFVPKTTASAFDTIPEGRRLSPYYPPNSGFSKAPINETLPPGTRIDRYGFEGGTFVSPEGVPAPMRALPPGSVDKPYNVYEVVEPIDVKSGPAVPWFQQPGLGTQHELPQSVGDLIEQGIIRRVD